jgi:2-polyprenyl-6-methoxyphenol hydroxylase-like FAD-dependent oxidoreductase
VRIAGGGSKSRHVSVARDKTKGAQDPRVVIVGAGPAGLALAIELGTRSIPCLLIEKNERAGHSPRAKTTNIRTREHLRRWGIAEQLAAASPFGVDYPVNILFVTRLSGHRIARFENALGCLPVRDSRYSEHSQWIPQYKLEAVLLEHARSLVSVDIQFSQEFLDFEQDREEVRVRVRDAARGTDRVIATKYLVGADGSHSVVRDRIGATMLGTFGLSRNYNAVFRAPGLAQAHRHGPGIMYWQINKDVPGLIGPMDQGDLWYFMPTGVPSGVTYSEDETCELIRKSTGIDLPYQVLSSDIWVASRLLADRYAAGRVFLTGDACHLHPPFGGYGMNMGIADSVDLGWKLAAVLQGWGGPALLDSYETERRPAHKYVMDEAEANHALSPNSLVRDGIEEANEHGASVRSAVADLIWQHKTAEFFSLGVVLGLCYRDSPIIATEPTQAEWKPSRDYVPSAAPGCLAPHWWLEDGKSIYDLFGLGFTLLIFDKRVADEAHSARREAEHTGTPLKIVTVLDDSLVELYGAPLALIRPDQHVAWRGHAWPAVGLLGLVCGRKPQTVPRSGYASAS